MPFQMEDYDITQCVQVKIELGHRASPRATPTKEGFTHDWTVYVRAPEGSNITHFVEKVVFHLHDTFANPRREVKEPPYHVSEMGYAGFGLPVEIYFKNKEEPRKIKFNYNLFLEMHEPVSYIRCEKLTFLNPTDEFKKMLIKAGGVHVLPPGKAQFADLFGSPIKTGSPKKQKQPFTISSKEKVIKQMLTFSGSSCKDISASLKSSDKQKKMDNSSKDHDAASKSSSSSSSSTSKEKVQKTQSSREKHSSKDSNSSSNMVPNPSPLPSQKRPSDSPIPSENNQKKPRQSSSMSSETVNSEDKQRSEEKAKMDKVVKHKSSENKDESKSKSNDGKDSHKTDTSKQKSSNSSKKKKRESKSKDDIISKLDDKKELKNDKKELKDDKRELKDDKKELQKDVKDDKKEGIDDNKVKHDKKEEKDGKQEVNYDKKDAKNDKKEVKEVQNDKKVKNDRKDYRKGVKEDNDDSKVNEDKDNKKEVKEVKHENTEVKEIKGNNKEVKAEKSSSLSENIKQDDRHKVDIKENADKEEKSSRCEHSSSKSSSKRENDKKEKSSIRNIKSEITTDAKQSKSEHRKRHGSSVSALDGPMAKKRRDSVKHLSKVTSMELKEAISTSSDSYLKSDDDFLGLSSDSDMDLDISPVFSSSKTSNKIYSKSDLKKLMDELEDNSADDVDAITNIVDVFSQPKSSPKNSPLVESGNGSPALSCKSNSEKLQKAISENSSTIKKPTFRKYSSLSESRKQDDKHKMEISVNANKEEKSFRCEHSSSKSSSKRENDKKEKSSNRNMKSEITTDAKKSRSEHRKRSDSPVSALDDIMAKTQQDSVKHLSKVTSIEMKEAIFLSSGISSQSDAEFLGEISGNDSDMDLDISPVFSTNKTSSKIYSKIDLKRLMDELEDNSADDGDAITNIVDVFPQPKSSPKNTPLVESGNASPALSCKSNSEKLQKAISENSSTIKKPTFRKYSSLSESRKQDDKHKVEIKVNADKEEKSSRCEHSLSKSSSKGENEKEKSSNRNMKSEITTDAKKSEHRKRSDSLVSALDDSIAKTWQDSVKHLSKVTSIEMKEDLSLSSGISSQSDADFLGEISENDSDMDLDISPVFSTSKTSNKIYSKSDLKKLMEELEDNSGDDGDDITDTVDIFSLQKSSAKNSPLVESGNASHALSYKSNSEKSHKSISENSSTIIKHTTPKDSQEKSSTKRVSESPDISDTRNKTQWYSTTNKSTKSSHKIQKG